MDTQTHTHIICGSLSLSSRFVHLAKRLIRIPFCTAEIRKSVPHRERLSGSVCDVCDVWLFCQSTTVSHTHTNTTSRIIVTIACAPRISAAFLQSAPTMLGFSCFPAFVPFCSIRSWSSIGLSHTFPNQSEPCVKPDPMRPTNLNSNAQLTLFGFDLHTRWPRWENISSATITRNYFPPTPFKPTPVICPNDLKSYIFFCFVASVA